MSATNAAQMDFWNGEVGQRWLSLEAQIEALNRSVTDYLLEKAVRQGPRRILEVGCGSGGLALQLASHLPASEVVAIDLSEPMLARARQRAAGYGNLTFLQADAQTADLPGPFDLILSSFGVMFFDDPVAAFANIRRAAKRGSHLLFATFGSVASNPWFSIPRRLAVDRMGDVPAAPANAPGPLAFSDGARVTGILSDAGWSGADAGACFFDFHLPGGPSAAADLALQLGPAAFVLRTTNASDEDRRIVSAAVTAAFAKFAQEDGVHLQVELNVFEAFDASEPPAG